MTDKRLQEELYNLFKLICNKVLSICEQTHLVLITNLIYDTAYLETILQMFQEFGIESQIQLHTSFDTKYRYKNKEEEQKWLAKYPDFDKAILKGLKEFGRTDLPVFTNMDYGHTLPQLILPYGVMAEINPQKKTVSLLESGVI